MGQVEKPTMIAVKTLLFVIFVPGSVTVLIPYWLYPSNIVDYPVSLGIFRYLGIIPILVGVPIYLKCAWDFTFTGQGTPAPIDPPKVLVAKGFYRHVRNPMYVGVVMQLFGEAWLFESAIILLYAAALLLGFHLFVVFYEEPILTRKFGDSYIQFCKTVPSWIPNIKSFKQ